MMFASDKGSRTFQLNPISWSYRNRGNVPRTQIYRNKKKKTRSANQNTGSIACSTGGPNRGPCQPPRNRIVARQATVTMLAYSAMKNIANFIELYSVW